MLAKILAKTHGFNCIVLFSTDEKAGYIDPNNQKNIRGTEVLDNADLMIIGTRFRQLPEAQLAPFALSECGQAGDRHPHGDACFFRRSHVRGL